MSSLRSEQPGREGVSELQAFWLFQLQHGNQLRVCFPCFKLLFLSFKESLGSGDWEEEDWDPEPVQHRWARPEEGPSLGTGPSRWQGEGQPEQDGLGDGGLDTLGSDPDQSEKLGLTPTEQTPQNAAPLGLGPQNADWTQGLAWQFGGIPTCSHWMSPYVLPQGFPEEVLPPAEPMLLEVVATWEVDLAQAESWLLSLQAMTMVGGPARTFLRHVSPRWVRRTPGPGWAVLLEPDDLYVLQLHRMYPGQDLSPWRLSLLESSPAGYGAQLVPAGTALLLRGFSVLSYAPWGNRKAEEGVADPGPEASPQGQGPGVAGTGSWGAGESLGPGGAPLCPAPQPEAQVTTRLPQAASGWEGQVAAPAPQPGELWGGGGGGAAAWRGERGVARGLPGKQHRCPGVPLGRTAFAPMLDAPAVRMWRW